MKKRIIAIALALSTPLLVNAAASTSVDDQTRSVLDFMENYEALFNTYDEALLTLYSDQAVLRGVQTFDNGSEQTIQFSFDQYSALFDSARGVAEARGERTSFSEIEVVIENDQAQVSAVAYNSHKCTHSDFEAVLQPNGESWLIVDEFRVIPARSQCSGELSTKGLPELLIAIADQTNPMLPAQIDEDTVLVQLIAEQTTLIYDYKILTLTSQEMPAADLESLMRPIVIAQSCNMANIRPILDQGATMRYQYTASDDVWLTEIDVSEQDC